MQSECTKNYMQAFKRFLLAPIKKAAILIFLMQSTHYGPLCENFFFNFLVLLSRNLNTAAKDFLIVLVFFYFLKITMTQLLLFSASSSIFVWAEQKNANWIYANFPFLFEFVCIQSRRETSELIDNCNNYWGAWWQQ